MDIARSPRRDRENLYFTATTSLYRSVSWPFPSWGLCCLCIPPDDHHSWERLDPPRPQHALNIHLWSEQISQLRAPLWTTVAVRREAGIRQGVSAALSTQSAALTGSLTASAKQGINIIMDYSTLSCRGGQRAELSCGCSSSRSSRNVQGCSSHLLHTSCMTPGLCEVTLESSSQTQLSALNSDTISVLNEPTMTGPVVNLYNSDYAMQCHITATQIYNLSFNKYVCFFAIELKWCNIVWQTLRLLRPQRGCPKQCLCCHW